MRALDHIETNLDFDAMDPFFHETRRFGAHLHRTGISLLHALSSSAVRRTRASPEGRLAVNR